MKEEITVSKELLDLGFKPSNISCIGKRQPHIDTANSVLTANIEDIRRFMLVPNHVSLASP